MRQAISSHERMTDLLKEAVTCGVCLDTLNDPHV